MSIQATNQAATVRTAAAGGALPRGPANVEQAIREASRETGVDFAYLMEKAAVESSFRTDLKASSSSATGLYQFIDSTWLSSMKAHGADYGLGQYADAIHKRPDGGFSVADPEMRKKILDLRKDPKISAELAAELTRENKNYLESKVGGTIGSTELYLAHFLGAAGASRFLNAMNRNSGQAARDVVPEAASSNTSVFYDKQSGQPKTLAQVYDRFARKFTESTGEITAGSGGSGTAEPLGQMITNVAAGRNPLTALGATPLSGYTMLALAALQTPDEARLETENQYGARRIGSAPESRAAAAARSALTGLGLRKAS
ncbi:MAG: hypothetical protein WCF85_03635 [Rhodospirillaceae bacterium]